MTLQGESYEVFKTWFLATQWKALAENETPADRYLRFIRLNLKHKYPTYVEFFRDKGITVGNINGDLDGKKWATITCDEGGQIVKADSFNKLEEVIISTANSFLNSLIDGTFKLDLVSEKPTPEPPKFPEGRTLKYPGFPNKYKNLLKWVLYSAATFLVLHPFGLNSKTLAVSLLVGWVFGILNEINSNLKNGATK